METLKAFHRDLSSSLESNKDVSPEDQKMICMQLFFFEGVMEEFKTLSKERDDLRTQNKKLAKREKGSETQSPILRYNIDEVKKLQEAIKSLEEEIHRLQKNQMEFDNLKEAHCNLSENFKSLSDLSAKQESYIKQLENQISNQQESISNLHKELKVLGKKPVSSIFESVDVDKIQSAGRLSFLLPLTNGQSTWIQFRKEKQWIQCSNCGSRGHLKPRGACLVSAESQFYPPKPKIYFQRSSNHNLGHMGRQSTDPIEKDVIPEKPLHHLRKSNVHPMFPKSVGPASLDNMDAESSSSSLLGISGKFRGGKIDNLMTQTREDKKVLLKRGRFESCIRPLDQKSRHMKIKLRGQRSSKPVEVFSSLLFPNENSKRMKPGSPDSLSHSRSLHPAVYPSSYI